VSADVGFREYGIIAAGARNPKQGKIDPCTPARRRERTPVGLSYYIQERIPLRKIDLPKPADQLPLDVVGKVVSTAWQVVKADVAALNGLVGLKPGGIKTEDLAINVRSNRARTFAFDLGLHVNVLSIWFDSGNFPEEVAKIPVPQDAEKYRDFVTRLNGWSHGGKKIVSDNELKKFTAAYPPKPTVYKDFDEMVKKSKSDVDAFRAWSKKNSKAGKAFAEVDKTAKLRPIDPVRAKALKAINDSLKDYYASF
jgi:hypothetical protein